MSTARHAQEEKVNLSTQQVFTALSSPPPKRISACDRLTLFLKEYIFIPIVRKSIAKDNLIHSTVKKGFGNVVTENIPKDTHIKKAKLLHKTIYFISGPSEIQQLSLVDEKLLDKETSVAQSRLIGRESIVAIHKKHSKYNAQRELVHRPGFSNEFISRIYENMIPYFKEMHKENSEINLNQFAARIALANTGLLLGFTENIFKEEDKIELNQIVHAIIDKLANPFTILNITIEDLFHNKIVIDIGLNALLKQGEELLRKIIDRNPEQVLTALQALTQNPTLTKKDLYTADTITLIKLFLIGGSDSTSKLLLFTLLMWGKPENKPFVEAVRKELSEFTKPIESISYKDLEALPNLNKFIYEVLRLYPPFTYRRHTVEKPFALSHSLPAMASKQECKIAMADEKRDKSADTNLVPGDILITSLYDAQRNPELYGADANQFNPDRWLKNKFSLRDTITFPQLFSFGNSSRSCAGRFMAVQIAMVLLMELSKFDLKHNLREELPLSLDFTLNLRKGVVALGEFKLLAKNLQKEEKLTYTHKLSL